MTLDLQAPETGDDDESEGRTEDESQGEFITHHVDINLYNS